MPIIEAIEQEVQQANDEVKAWSEAHHLREMHDALYQHDKPRAWQLHQAASRAFEESGLSRAVREVIQYNLLYYGFFIGWVPPSTTWNKEGYLAAKRAFSTPALTTPGSLERLSRLLSIRVNAHRDGFEPLTHDQMMKYVDQLKGYPHPDVWFAISRWAFHHSDLELIARAFETQLINPASVTGYAQWQRINLQYQIVAGKASRRDVAETILTLEILPQLKEFRNEIWPRCEELGLVDDELREELEQRSARIEAERPAPRRIPRTQRIKRV